MPQITWDNVGEHYYETGTDRGVLYTYDSEKKAYKTGVAWNGLTSVKASPSGAESNPFYADNIKYLNLISAEEFGATIEAYTYPDEFAVCDGTAALADLPGAMIGQQKRKTFGFSWRTRIGNDTDGDSLGYKIHVFWNGIASPSEKDYSTVNDSPEPVTFSWEVTTTPIPFSSDPKFKELRPCAYTAFDSRTLKPEMLNKLEGILYGGESGDAKLPPNPEALFKELLGSKPAGSSATS